jgi:hypothetical protein
MPDCADFGKYNGETPKEFTLNGFEFQQISEFPGHCGTASFLFRFMVFKLNYPSKVTQAYLRMFKCARQPVMVHLS